MSRNNLIKKGLAIVVILLFIGMGFIPSTGTCVDTDIDYNNPPTAPIFLGPTRGVAGEEYRYTINSTDPDGDDVYYVVIWEPGVLYEGFGPYPSGEEVNIGHTWDERGTYYVLSEAWDTYNATSDFTILEVIIGETIYVDDDNVEGPWNGTAEYPYQYIQDGIDNASDGDTVFVYNGIYVENLVVDKSINLIGEDRNTTIIDGNNSGDVVYVPDDGVNISGFTITNGSSGNAGISISGNHNTIKDNRLLENNYDGIRIHGRFDNIIENEISNNSHNAIALGLDAEDNTIVDNTIANNGGFGILIWSGRNVIENNVISNNLAYGIYLHYSDRNVIENNIISSNFEYGIYIDSSSVNNSIYHNNFVNHTENAYDKCNNTWDNGYPSGGNYWDDYNGVDNDGDGIGDTPYNIPGGDNQDRYPLMRPYGQTELEITKVKGGIFSFTIKNIGDETAIDVSWSIHFEGGIVFPREQHSFNNYNLAPDEERTIVLWPSWIPEERYLVLGIGRVTITMVANADNAPLVSKSTPGFLFLFFIMINPGG